MSQAECNIRPLLVTPHQEFPSVLGDLIAELLLM